MQVNKAKKKNHAKFLASRNMGRSHTTLTWGSKSKKCELINSLEANNIPVAMVQETHFQSATNFKCQIT